MAFQVVVLRQSESLVHCSLLQIAQKLTQLLHKRTKTWWWWKRTEEQVFLNNLYLDTEGYLYTIPDGFAPARKSYRIGPLFTHKNGDFAAMSVTLVTELSCAAPIFKLESHKS